MKDNESKQIKALKDAARKKRAATLERVLIALKVMEEQQIPINFESVANFAKVSKTTLYADLAIKTQINKTRENFKRNHYMQEQAIKIKGKDKEIAILNKQIKNLRQMNDELKKQLEVAYASYLKD
ncbi:TPA: DUF6262 family protein [Legionella pneumophila]|nr:DUF6262 family protein [Legionella pneumophila]HAT1659548.1 transposase [Legionella pneumophila]HAT1660842.1 transposase [Legionella pneumophila]HAT1883618.1 transposase [Legionella pneumophila]HAT2114455.1 transposase [Legionella pneumophila]HAT2116212.1 transposase [Legionella pneumophila]